MASQLVRCVRAYRLRLISAVLMLAWPALTFAQGDAKKGTVENLGIPHTFETYEGDYSNKVVERLETRVLPFFTKNLSFAATK